jgi:hypothetical protein
VVVADGEVGFFEDGASFLIGEGRFDGDEPAELVEEAGDGLGVEASGGGLGSGEDGLCSVSTVPELSEFVGYFVWGEDPGLDRSHETVDALSGVFEVAYCLADSGEGLGTGGGDLVEDALAVGGGEDVVEPVEGGCYEFLLGDPYRLGVAVVGR